MKREIKELPICSIMCRNYPHDTKTLEYALLLRCGGQFPPIKVYRRKKGGFVIKDGRHRFLAHKLNGRRKISAIIYEGKFSWLGRLKVERYDGLI